MVIVVPAASGSLGEAFTDVRAATFMRRIVHSSEGSLRRSCADSEIAAYLCIAISRYHGITVSRRLLSGLAQFRLSVALYQSSMMREESGADGWVALPCYPSV